MHAHAHANARSALPWRSGDESYEFHGRDCPRCCGSANPARPVWGGAMGAPPPTPGQVCFMLALMHLVALLFHFSHTHTHVPVTLAFMSMTTSTLTRPHPVHRTPLLLLDYHTNSFKHSTSTHLNRYTPITQVEEERLSHIRQKSIMSLNQLAMVMLHPLADFLSRSVSSSSREPSVHAIVRSCFPFCSILFEKILCVRMVLSLAQTNRKSLSPHSPTH